MRARRTVRNGYVMAPVMVDRAFFGREAQLATLIKCAQGARAGQPWVVVVDGEPGIGKTALLRELSSRPELDGFTLLRASCHVSEADLAYGVVAQLLSSRRKADKRRSHDITIQASSVSFQVGARLMTVLGELQERGPVALVLDDMQWADAKSIHALTFALRRLEADSVLTVIAMRSAARELPFQQTINEVRRLVQGTQWGCQITLRGLDARELAVLMEHKAGHPVSAAISERLRKHTGGNPLYALTIMAEISADYFRHVASPPLPVPSSLTAAVREQIAELGAGARALLEASAVLDAHTPLHVVARVAGVGKASEALEPLIGAGLVDWWPTDPTRPIMVRHALQRDAVLAMASPLRLRQLHAEAALVVEPFAAWRHRVAASEHADSVLARQLELASEEYIERGETERAATLLLWAADVSESRAEREKFLLSAAIQWAWVDQFAIARLRPLLTELRSCSPCPERDLVLGLYATSTGELTKAETLISAVLDATITDQRKPRLAGVAGTILLLVHTLTGDGKKIVSTCNRMLELDQLPGVIADRVKGNLAFGTALMAGASAGLEELVRFAHVPPPEEATVADAYLLRYRGVFKYASGQLAEGVEDLQATLRLAQQDGYAVRADLTYAHLAAAQYWIGAWDDSLTSVDHAIAIASTSDLPWVLPWGYAFGSFVLSGRGEWASAQEQLASSRRWGHVMAHTWQFHLAIGQAILAQARGDYNAMLKVMEPIAREPDEGTCKLYECWWRVLHAEALIGTGRLDAAATAVAHLTTGSKECAYTRVAAFWLSGWLAERCGDVARARVCYEEGISRHPSADDPPLHLGLLHHAYGRFLLHRGQAREAALWLDKAATGFDQLRAAPFLGRCNADLQRLSRRPQAGRRKGYAVELSQREREIALLVGRGYTNREISSMLFISTKTVEYHLSHIYAKLHMGSRYELRDHMNKDAINI